MEKQVFKSSGNVFRDLGVANPEIMKLKSGLVNQIRQIIKKRRLTQKDAGLLMGVDQPKVSALIRGDFSGYSIDRLFSFLASLNAHIDIEVSVKKWPDHGLDKASVERTARRPSQKGKYHLHPLVSPETRGAGQNRAGG
jgi:predicted XRE-type DNA-binding protein